MKLLILFVTSASLASCGVISHEDLGEETHHHERATSYQNIHMEHFHAVPTYIKKEHQHLLEHPISIGKSSSKVEIHHGGKHDHGYAIASVDNDVHGHGGNFGDLGHEDSGLGHGAEAVQEAGYQVHDQGSEYAHQYQDQGQATLGQAEGHEEAGLGHYQLETGNYHQDAQVPTYEHESR